jgi:hypothetical protein
MHMTCRKPGLGCGELSRWPGAAALATWREPGEGLRTRLLDSGILTLPLAGEGFHVELPIGWPHRQRRTGGRAHPSGVSLHGYGNRYSSFAPSVTRTCTATPAGAVSILFQ